MPMNLLTRHSDTNRIMAAVRRASAGLPRLLPPPPKLLLGLHKLLNGATARQQVAVPARIPNGEPARRLLQGSRSSPLHPSGQHVDRLSGLSRRASAGAIARGSCGQSEALSDSVNEGAVGAG